ncbi:hypothetical protein H8L32_21490 [Undibacterium sp. CY18W]|uniref:Uncharacterized protein n=1 Tax=Undibacterium hunanense TaxID=2762292 RepID=A0ABR6ZWY3_9BURK|nr:hypothetical protein [Undibacterium hunanense]MBC3920055.1 hypothetical protein [Undibacterium hunanense]
MKNRHIEELKRKAKLHHKNARDRHFENGIVVRHVYDIENPEKLSWWDDVLFILNDYRVNVAWTHPRYVYKSMVDESAYSALAKTENQSKTDFMEGHSPNYRKVGKSRKKIVSYSSMLRNDDAYFEALRAERSRIAYDPDNAIIITPTISVDWSNWSRYVSICAPIEIRGVEDLHVLATLTKRILKRETSLSLEFPGYAYSQQNWHTEFTLNDQIGLLSHAVKM